MKKRAKSLEKSLLKKRAKSLEKSLLSTKFQRSKEKASKIAFLF
jgi:hypothetical protein